LSEYGDCVVLKLMNGDQCMGRFLNEDDDHIVFEDLVLVKPIQIMTEGGTIEKTVTTPYCPIAEDTIFRFHKRNVLFVKALDSTVAKLYNKLVKSFEHELPDIDPDDVLGEKNTEDQESFLVIPEDSSIH